jgi:MYXO-CTERM domain-containing protein
MSNPTSDLIQTTMDAWGGTENLSYCNSASSGGMPTQWCVEASVFGSFGQRNGPTVAIDADDHVTIDYLLESDNETWLQTVTSQKLGMVVSTLTSASGEMPLGGFGFATEADSCSFTIDTQYYLCSEIDLYAADPNFDKTGSGGVGAQMGNTGTGSGIGTAKNIHTPDNGKTWLVDLITLPAMNPQGTQASVPAYNCETDAGVGGSGGSGGTGGSAGTGGIGGSGGSGGKGGSAGSGGSAGVGGSAGAGGEGGSGGSAGATGGSGGSAGSGETDGSVGTAGAAGAGGSAGSAGSGGTGGSIGTAGAAGAGGSGGSAGASTTPDSGGAHDGDGGVNSDTSGQSGGCGCRTAGSRELPGGALLGLAAVGVFGAFRGRRRGTRTRK